MIGVLKKSKKTKDPEIENQKIIENHEKAAMLHEAAALLHHEAAKFQIAGDSTMACGCNIKAKIRTNLAKKIENKNQKKQALII